jgi:hypothetical protein
MYRYFIECSLFILVIVLMQVQYGFADFDKADTDGDGWSDVFEKKLGTDAANKDSQPSSIDDPDMDGLTNEEERAINTDPTDPDTDNDGLSDRQEAMNRTSDPLKADTDEDGSNDFIEIIDGTNPRVPDSDGDGWLDGAEKLAGSDPLDRSSTPKN